MVIFLRVSVIGGGEIADVDTVPSFRVGMKQVVGAGRSGSGMQLSVNSKQRTVNSIGALFAAACLLAVCPGHRGSGRRGIIVENGGVVKCEIDGCGIIPKKGDCHWVLGFENF